MKKLSVFIAGLFVLLLSFNGKAQPPGTTDYFTGKWAITTEGTPQGDGKMNVTLERKDGKLSGYLTRREGSDTSKFTKVEEKERSVTVYFTTSGYNVYITLEKKDEDNVTGNMLDMYDVKGARVKETASK